MPAARVEDIDHDERRAGGKMLSVVCARGSRRPKTRRRDVEISTSSGTPRSERSAVVTAEQLSHSIPGLQCQSQRCVSMASKT